MLTVEQVIRAEILAAGPPVSITSVASEIGETYAWLSNRLIGRTKLSDRDIERIRAVLNKPQGWPYDRIEQDRPVRTMPMAAIKVVGSANAGDAAMSTSDEDEIYVPAHMGGENHRGLIVAGISMLPYIQPGDIAVFRESKVPKLRKVFLVRTEDGPRIKEIIYREGEFLAHSFNPAYIDEPLQGELVGFLVGLYRVDGFREEIYFDPHGLSFAK